MKTHLENAESIVKKLREAGFIALFAGGWVRDFLLGRPCEDIDIATDAAPDTVRKLFPRSIAVGIQFGVVRVIEHHHEFEVATFRSDDQYIDGRRPEKISLLTTPREDALRRDFTINGMFYDPIQKEVLDFVGGREDLKKGILRTIGDPEERFAEDRLRVIRAIRFKNTFRFDMDKKTWNAVCRYASKVVEAVSSERIWQELQKMLSKKILASCLHDMNESGLSAQIFSIPKVHFKRVSSYQGDSLAAALCLLLYDDPEARKATLSRFKLSRNDQKIETTFLEVVSFFQKKRHAAEEYVYLYALPYIDIVLEAYSLLKKNRSKFVTSQKRRRKELSFWIDQLTNKSFLVTGADLQSLGILPGVEMGKRISQAFSFSIKKRIRDKKTILEAIQGTLSHDA